MLPPVGSQGHPSCKGVWEGQYLALQALEVGDKEGEQANYAICLLSLTVRSLAIPPFIRLFLAASAF